MAKREPVKRFQKYAQKKILQTISERQIRIEQAR